MHTTLARTHAYMHTHTHTCTLAHEQRGDKLVEYDDKKERALTRDQIKCPEGWMWKGNWTRDMGRAVDEDGGHYIEPHDAISSTVHVYRLGVRGGVRHGGVGAIRTQHPPLPSQTLGSPQAARQELKGR